ncbi:TetR/AcrR family transcriptional regulator [Streptomyces sp. NPDC055722]
MGEPHDRTPLPAILRSALTNESAAAVFRRLVAMRLLRRAAGRLDIPEPALPAELAVAQLIGVAVPRSVIKVEPLASADLEQLVARVAPVVQRTSHEPFLRTEHELHGLSRTLRTVLGVLVSRVRAASGPSGSCPWSKDAGAGSLTPWGAVSGLGAPPAQWRATPTSLPAAVRSASRSPRHASLGKATRCQSWRSAAAEPRMCPRRCQRRWPSVWAPW